MSRQKTEVITCDICGSNIPSTSRDILAVIGSRDCCRECTQKVFLEAEEAYRLMYHGEVRSRRGGWRQLGDFGDT